MNAPKPSLPAARYDVTALPFVLFHVVAVAGAWLFPPTLGLVALAAILYVVRMFGVTAGYHRYFAHRTFKTSRGFQLILALLGTLSIQKGVLWWAGHHRNHHRLSDTEEDIHSPLRRGFWWSHVGWFLSHDHDQTPSDRIRDFERYPELRWLNRFWAVPIALFAALLLWAGGWPALVWGGFVSSTLLWHSTFAINSMAHLFGRRRYATTDGSRNSWLLAVLTLGEGWHNNHHYYQSSTRNGFFWWELDLTYATLKALSWVGVVWDLRQPPAWVLKNERPHPIRSS